MAISTIVNSIYQKTFIVDINSNYSQDTNPLQLTNLAAIENMILNVISTNPGERPFQPLFGSGIPQLLFNNITQQNAYAILHDMFFSISNYVPGVQVNVAASQVYADLVNGIYYIILVYTVSGLSGPITSTLSLSSTQ